MAEYLPTLPFEVLRQLYDTTPLGTDDGRLLRTISISVGVTKLLLTCLAIFTHQIEPQTANNMTNPGSSGQEGSREGSTGRTDDKSQLYWAKGKLF